MTNPLAPLARRLAARSVRYLLIGVSGANLYAPSGQAFFTTDDVDLFLPTDPANLVEAWTACEESGLDLSISGEPLDRPRDQWLAERVVARTAVIRAAGRDDFFVDLTLVMKGYDFETVWRERRHFVLDGVEIPVARLLHIVNVQTCDQPRQGPTVSRHPSGGAGGIAQATAVGCLWLIARRAKRLARQ